MARKKPTNAPRRKKKTRVRRGQGVNGTNGHGHNGNPPEGEVVDCHAHDPTDPALNSLTAANGANGPVSGTTPGPGNPCEVGSIDFSRREDLRLVRAFGSGPGSRWNIGPERRQQCIDALFHGLEIATRRGDACRIAAMTKTLSTLEGQVQADEHLALKNERLDAGLATENVQYVYNFEEATPDRG